MFFYSQDVDFLKQKIVMSDIMLSRVDGFPAQLLESLEIGSNATLHTTKRDFNKVVVFGMGGSGFGANLVAELIADELSIPYLTVKDYHAPNYIDKDTLIIASSYSGNTEETLTALNSILDRKPTVVCVTSGGKLAELAKQNNFDIITVPGGFPPRSCLGYSFIQQLYILNKLDLISDRVIKETHVAAELIVSESESIKNIATDIAAFLYGKLPVIYTTGRMSSIALRARQQINENSKYLCMHQIVPEMNHNEVIGWRHKSEDKAVLFLRNEDDVKRNQARIEINKEIILKYTPYVKELYSKGDSLVEKAMYLNHIIDYASVYLGHKYGMDATEVDAIDYLKSELAKL